MSNIVFPILIAILGLNVFIYFKRKQNLNTLMEQLENPIQSGSLFWGGSIRGKYQGREVLCYSHSKATQLFMNISFNVNPNLSTKSVMFSLPSFWPKVSKDCHYKDGRLYYAGFGIYGLSFYYRQMSASEFREVLNKMARSAEIVVKDGEGSSYSLISKENFNFRLLLIPVVVFLMGIVVFLKFLNT